MLSVLNIIVQQDDAFGRADTAFQELLAQAFSEAQPSVSREFEQEDAA